MGNRSSTLHVIPNIPKFDDTIETAGILGTLRPVVIGSYQLFIFTLIHFLMRTNCVGRRLK